MIYKYLPILLLLISNYTYAKNGISIPATENTSIITNTSENGPHLVMPESIAVSAIPSAYSRGGGRRITGYSEIELAYANASTTKNGVTGKGAGFAYRIELGIKYLMPTKFATRFNFISFGLSFSQVTPKVNYTLVGASTHTGYQLTMVDIPLSYCSINNEHPVGFYWQIGASMAYIYKGTADNAAGINKFNSIGVEPSVSTGLSIRYEHRDRELCALIGLYASDMLTNVAADNGASMHFYTIGIRYTSIAM